MKSANFVYFSGGSPIHLYDSIHNSKFSEELKNVENRGIIAGCSAGAMIMGEKMIKGTGLKLFTKYNCHTSLWRKFLLLDFKYCKSIK
jgi:cyanophycinase-like exopeptidase